MCQNLLSALRSSPWECQLTNCRGTQAVGVEYVFDKQVYLDEEQTVHTVHASRLVVVSAGAKATPPDPRAIG